MTVLGLSPPCHTLLLLQFGMGGAVKCRGVLSSPILIPPPLGGVEEEDEALLPPINSLPFSPWLSLAFFAVPPRLLRVRLTRRPHVPGPGVG